jgi:hypothetical protein
MKIRVDKLMEDIMSSVWNNDLNHGFPRGIQDFEDWSKKSIGDPMLWRKIELLEHYSKTVEGVVDMAMKEVAQ